MNTESFDLTDDDGEWFAYWDRLQTAIEEIDFEPVLSDVMEGLTEVHYGYFVNEEGPDGYPWTPLAPSTIAKKGHDQILIEFGPLSESLVGLTGDSVREIVTRPGSGELAYGTSVEYSIYHNADTGREHIGINDQHVESICDLVLAAGVDHIKKVA